MKSFSLCLLFCSSLVVAQILTHLTSIQIDPSSTTLPSTTPTTPTTTTTTTPLSTSTTDTSQKSSTSSSSPSSAVQTTSSGGPPPSGPSLTTIIASGSEVIVTFTSSTSPSPSSSDTASHSPPASSDSSGLGTGSIVGLSVAGGVALIGVVAFFIWKFTRKRFSDFDDNEAIKWPDLNNHASGTLDSHPLPVNSTGRSGFDTASDQQHDLSLSNNYSTQDFNQSIAPDPYAVPPLPHLNPNQPYRDDPSSISAYYDPYRGPVPGTIEESALPTAPPEWGSEAIPMTQMGLGRLSPAPPQQFSYDGRRSPGPYDAYGANPAIPGRSSPSPYDAYAGRTSPGPQLAYNTGSVSPAPGHRT